MQARRRLLMMPHGIDTSPIIEVYDKTLRYGNFIDATGYGVTIIYNYELANSRLDVKTSGTGIYNQLACYKDGVYKDYWSAGNYHLTSNTNGVRACIMLSQIDNVYFYIVQTGKILFAGKNTPYYGYTNINDMPSA